ncbi:hypothetical protein NPX13_g3637 [Xylaria arbuscula]|uniref:Uncharacterized protein n=1 Tax=Xylaria arbuscula TaxID=114810 RepID=A0A9W8NI41_9PEZI|nr:hypothetical protein NPX13_g3637 [Xylaria arbuscula]
MEGCRGQKRQRAGDSVPHDSNTHNKRPKLSARRNFPPEFWDRLSKVFLTGRALRELDRRNAIQSLPAPPKSEEELFSGTLSRFARCGGPSIVDLRGCPIPRSSPTFFRSYTESLDMENKTTSSSSRGPEFERHLADHGIYLHNKRSTALNLRDIRDRIELPRDALSISHFSQEDFENFERINAAIANEDDVMIEILPVLCGANKIFSKRNFLFTEFTPITDGSTSKPKPDMFDGAHLDEIDNLLRKDGKIYPLIIPTKHLQVPVAPNFFLEVKSQRGDPAVLKRQACYDGANGARAMHCLQNYGKSVAVYDGNAYTFSAIYHPGLCTLELYAHHLTKPAVPGGKPNYHMTKVTGHYLGHNRQYLADALTAFRNLRDLARECRDKFIKVANDKARSRSPEQVVAGSRTPKKRQYRRRRPLAKMDKPTCDSPRRKSPRSTRKSSPSASSKSLG